MAKGKIGTILVRLVSSAGTGYTYVKVRTSRVTAVPMRSGLAQREHARSVHGARC
jgi:hypothetical protein